MMDLRNPRTWDDETIDAAVSSRSIYQWRDAGTTMPTLSVWAQAILDEAARRAEIRIERGEYGGQHDAAWYEPRPRCESGWTGDRCTFDLFHDGPHSN